MQFLTNKFAKDLKENETHSTLKNIFMQIIACWCLYNTR